ncbi:MAG: OmpH family outer membrane protein [Puniceicoccales bacterium]|nr:OmpH family outer membrane protein [Puniceicoccales bacterium]
MKMHKVVTFAAVLGALALAGCGKDDLSPHSGIVTVDIGKVYSKYNRAERSREQFQEAVEKAQGELRGMLEEGVKMAQNLKEMQEKLDNPSLTDASRARMRKEIEGLTEDIRRKEVELNTFRQQTDRELMERREEFVTKHIEEIRDTVRKIVKKRSVSLVLNTSGVEVVYSLPDMDITEKVIDALNDGN